MNSLPAALALSLRQLGDPAILKVLVKTTLITLAIFAGLAVVGGYALDAALGEAGLAQCEDRVRPGLPRASLLASPAVWRGGHLVAAPLAGFADGWSATLLRDEELFFASILAH